MAEPGLKPQRLSPEPSQPVLPGLEGDVARVDASKDFHTRPAQVGHKVWGQTPASRVTVFPAWLHGGHRGAQDTEAEEGTA